MEISRVEVTKASEYTSTSIVYSHITIHDICMNFDFNADLDNLIQDTI